MMRNVVGSDVEEQMMSDVMRDLMTDVTTLMRHSTRDVMRDSNKTWRKDVRVVLQPTEHSPWSQRHRFQDTTHLRIAP